MFWSSACARYVVILICVVIALKCYTLFWTLVLTLFCKHNLFQGLITFMGERIYMCKYWMEYKNYVIFVFNPLNAELNPICYLLALLGAHHFLHVSRIRVKSLTLRQLMSCIYGEPILDVSRSHTTTPHSQ